MKTVDFAIGKRLPLDILMQPVFLGGGRGSGKTSGAKTLYEAAHDAGAQCIAIAPTGKWWSLRLAADGKSPGLADVFVFGGPHADVPLTPDAGATIAKLLVEKRVHAVLDVSLMRKGERARFLAAFLEEFWLLKKLENESYPVVVFVEEAHAVVPQRPQPDEARMLGAAEDLVREGRNHGIGVVLLDQRAAVVNKNVLALVEVLLVLRTIHHLDRKTFAEWVVEKGDGERGWLEELPSLKAGEAYLYAPVLELFARITMRMPRTLNATATARIGERGVKTGTLTPVDVGALRESMAEVIAQAERTDPKALQREVARLRAELAQKPAAVPAAKPERIITPIIGPELAVQIQNLAMGCKGLAGAIAELFQRYPTDAGNARTVPAPRPPMVKTSPAANPPARRHQVATGDARPGKGELAVLTAVAQHLTGVTREQLSVLTGYKRSSRDTYLQKLGAAGLIEQRGDRLQATTDGVRQLGDDFEPLPTGEALRDHWLGRLPKGERGIFKLLIDSWPAPLAREAISDATGYKRSSRDTYLQKLGARQLIGSLGGEVVASETLFQ